MDREEVLERVINSLRRVQQESGSEVPDLSEDTNPLELEGFDSVRCVDFEVILSVEFNTDIQNVLIKDESPDENLSVGQIVDEVMALLSNEKGGSPDV